MMYDIRNEATTDRELNYIEFYKDKDLDTLNNELAEIESMIKSNDEEIENSNTHYDNKHEAELNNQMLNERKRIINIVIRHKQLNGESISEQDNGNRVK